MIEVRDLVFEYPGVRALDNVSLAIRRGEITALVGPNGAGKTTLMRCLAALASPVAGTISIDGLDVLEHPREAHLKIGYLADFFGLYTTLTVRQCLVYAARSHYIAADREQVAVETAARRLGLADRLNDKAGSLSRGLSQRLAIAQAIVHEPEFLILDEPASGLDPEARKSLSGLFLELKEQGITLLVSSHILSELEEYSDHMIIVRQGRIAEHQDIARQQQETMQIRVRLASVNEGMEQWLAQQQGVMKVVAEGGAFLFRFGADQQTQQQLLKTMIANDWPVLEFHVEKQNLHDAYLEQVSRMDGGDQHAS